MGPEGRRRTGFLVFLPGATLALLSLHAGPAPRAAEGDTALFPRHVVEMKDGRRFEVAAIERRDGQAILTMAEGQKLGIPWSRVARVDRIRHQARPASPAPAPEPQRPTQPPAPPAVPAAAPAVPTPPPTIKDLIEQAADRYDLDTELLEAVISVESAHRPGAVSRKGAQGLMQLMPATARELNVTDPFDPAQNIDAGARYLRQLIDRNEGQYWRALAAYNAGNTPVTRYDGLPPYRETMQYVKQVMSRYLESIRKGGVPDGAAADAR